MSPYETMQAHIAKHKYIKGANKGDAPLDPDRRRRDWERVIQRSDRISVHRYSTDILDIYPDGRIVVDCGGWSTSQTTRICVTHALHRMGVRASMGSVRYRNASQPCLNLPSGTYKYYDEMTLVQRDGEWTPVRPAPFSARVTDTDKLGAFNEGLKHSGFKKLFPLIYAGAEVEQRWLCSHIESVITNSDFAELWPGLVAYYKWRTLYQMRSMSRVWGARTAKETWHAIINPIKRACTKTITTDVTVL